MRNWRKELNYMKNHKKLSVLILTLFLLGCGAGCQQAPQPLSDVPDYAENWKGSSLSFDKYSVDMPAYDTETYDYLTKYICTYKDTEYNLYQFTLSSYSYSGGIIDSDMAVSTAYDAVETSEWLINAWWSKAESKTIDFKISKTEDKLVDSLYTSKITAQMNGVEYIGFWVEQTNQNSHLWVAEKGNGDELLERIYESLYAEA